MSASSQTPPTAHEPGGLESQPTAYTPLGVHSSRERRGRHAGTRRAITAVKAQHAADRTAIELVADRLTHVASSTPFLVLHVIWFGAWIVWNTGLAGVRPFDPYPFGLLTMIVSLEAIFLSIFVLMSQSREATIAELREEVTLAVNLRMEEEVTKTLQLVAGLYSRLGHRLSDDPELRDMLRPLDAEAIERDLLEQIEACAPGLRKNGKGREPAVGSGQSGLQP